MALWTIYKHTSPTGKSYVGQTRKENPKDRWQNGEGYKNNTEFYNDICLYGWDAFTHEILESGITSQEQADKREVYWIKICKSFENGYNRTPGGHEGGYSQKGNANGGRYDYMKGYDMDTQLKITQENKSIINESMDKSYSLVNKAYEDASNKREGAVEFAIDTKLKATDYIIDAKVQSAEAKIKAQENISQEILDAKEGINQLNEEKSKLRLDIFSDEKGREQNRMYGEYLEGSIKENFEERVALVEEQIRLKKEVAEMKLQLIDERAAAEREIRKKFADADIEIQKKLAETERNIASQKLNAEIELEKIQKKCGEIEKDKIKHTIWKFLWPALGVVAGVVSYALMFLVV